MKINDDKAVKILGALAQTTRFQVFRLLMKQGPEGLAAGVISAELGVPQNTLSSHLAILSGAGVIQAARQGRSLIYSVDIEATKDFIDYLVIDCCEGHPGICSLPGFVP